MGFWSQVDRMDGMRPRGGGRRTNFDVIERSGVGLLRLCTCLYLAGKLVDIGNI